MSLSNENYIKFSQRHFKEENNGSLGYTVISQTYKIPQPLIGYGIPITHYPLPITQKSGFPPQVRENHEFSRPFLEKSNLNKNFDIYPSENKNRKKNQYEKFIFQLDSLLGFDDIIVFLEKRVSSNKIYLSQRIKELKELCDSEQDCDISLDSLKSMLLFIFVVKNFSKPSLTMNESGYFQLSWRKNINNLITLRFKNEYFLDYVIFKSSRYFEKRLILNGSMNILDFIDYINALKLTLHQEV